VPEQEYADLYKIEMPKLTRYLMKCFGDRDMHDSVDAAQSAFTELFDHWDEVRNRKAWLRKVAFRQMLVHPAGTEYPLDVLRQEPAAPPASLQLELREETKAVLDLLLQLPLTQRQVLALRMDQFPTREIAQIMKISEAAVRKNEERARRTMKKLRGIT
jgi:RNA polymerase sigma factor (sigma-70 family)